MPKTEQPLQPWATIEVRFASPDPTAEEIDRLDGLGTVLAGETGVGGVERRDSGTLVGAQIPELWVYTTPPAVEALEARIAAIADAMRLDLRRRVEVHHEDDWRESWKRFYQPQVIGEQALLLRPSWTERRPGDPLREVVLDPGRAFGTGLHESTRLCLERLCGLWSEGFVPKTILDLGCGSGILALAAARLFPDAALWAIDMDEESVDTTRENAELNDLQARITLAVGMVVDSERGPFDLVIANIRPRVLIPDAASIRSRVAPGGRVLLSGILIEEAPDVAAAYVAEGLHPSPDVTAQMVTMGEWQAVQMQAP